MPAAGSYLRRLQTKLISPELTPRLLVALFCTGMILGLLVRGWVPGAENGGDALHASVSQMSGVFPAALAEGGDGAHSGRLSGEGRWMVHFSEDGRVLDVRPEK